MAGGPKFTTMPTAAKVAGDINPIIRARIADRNNEEVKPIYGPRAPPAGSKYSRLAGPSLART
jgi:hypothetical protein